MMNAFKYFLTAISDIKQAEISKGVGTQELEQITFEFKAVVEVGPNLTCKRTTVFVYGYPSEQLVSIVQKSVEENKQFQLELVPQSNGTFVVSPC